jgi:hypothetical protein
LAEAAKMAHLGDTPGHPHPHANGSCSAPCFWGRDEEGHTTPRLPKERNMSRDGKDGGGCRGVGGALKGEISLARKTGSRSVGTGKISARYI